MSNRTVKRKRIKVDQSLLTNKSKCDLRSWIIQQDGHILKVTLRPTKGYSIFKIK